MPYFGTALIVSGIGLALVAQLLMALNALTESPLAGLMCLFVPMYIVVYSKKSPMGKKFLNLWWLGLGLLVAGGVIAS